MGKMDGMVAVVTGSSRGLGRAIAKEYAREGAKVVVCARPQSPTGLPGTASETADAIQAAGGDALSVPCDVTDESQVKSMVQQAMDKYGQIDVLVNNAGIMVLGEPFLDIDPERWDRLMRINVRGTYLVSRSVVPVMMQQKRGSIISIGSRSALHPSAGDTVYGPSKVAVQMFSLCLAEELKEHNIAVNVLSPGGMKSEGSSVMEYAKHDWNERVDPEVVGPCAVYLALQTPDTFTGNVVQRADFGKTWGL